MNRDSGHSCSTPAVITLYAYPKAALSMRETHGGYIPLPLFMEHWSLQNTKITHKMYYSLILSNSYLARIHTHNTHIAT